MSLSLPTKMLASKLKTILNNNILTTNQAKQIHARIIIHGKHLKHIEPLLVRPILLSTKLYSLSIPRYVHNILRHSQHPDAFSWGCAIRYLSQLGKFKDALSLYSQMQRRTSLRPSSFAVSSALRACARIENKTGGIAIHGQTYKYGFYRCVYVQTALVDLYSKVGNVDKAKTVFDEMVEKNVVSWNSLLSGYVRAGNLVEAREVFDQMPVRDIISWNSMVSGYAGVGDMKQACLLFEEMPERNCASWNAMIGGHADCRNLESARKVFDEMPERNGVSWVTMITGYSKSGDVESARELFDQMGKKDLLLYNAIISCFVRNNRPKEALLLFNDMLKADANIQPDEMTLVSVISACSQLGDLKFCLWIESYIKSNGMEMDDQLRTALIDLHSKCGSIDKAYDLFQSMKKKDVIAYSAMIFGCGINGKVVDAIKLFEAMVGAHIHPNTVTFTGLLTAHNHAGLVEEGYNCFVSIRDYDLEPSMDHYAIMADLLGRTGRFQEAYDLIKGMPMEPCVEIWGALLLACSIHNNVEFGELAARHCFALEPDTTAYYSLLANVYASVGRWDDARKLRKKVEKKKLIKIPGYSWIERT